MDKVIYQLLLILIAIWEVGMCYGFCNKILCFNKMVDARKKILKTISIILVGLLLGINRHWLFSSSTMLIFCIIVTAYCIKIIYQEKIRVILGWSGIYYISLAFLDFVFAFICMEYLGNDFLSVIYVEAVSLWNILIYLLSRLGMLALTYALKRLPGDFYKISESCANIILGFAVIFYFLWKRYQIVLDEMALKEREIHGIEEGVSIITLMVVVLFGGSLFYRYLILKEETKLLLMQEQLMKEKFQEMMKSRQAVHDMKNHVLLLQKLEKEKKWRELHDYLQKIGESIIKDTGERLTGIEEIDFQLNQKITEAKKKNIKIGWDIPLVKEFPLPTEKMIALLGNLMDNAIEACERMKEKDKWIKIYMKSSYQLLFIKIENSMEGEVKKKGDHFLSVKSKNDFHGYGLKSVRYIVSQYDGDITFQVEEGAFCVKISIFQEGETMK